MYLSIIKLTILASIAYGFIKILVTTNSSTNVIWRKFFLYSCVCCFFLITGYDSEPIHCCSPDIFDRIHSINLAQSHNWQMLSDSLRVAMNAELTRRRQIGAVSSGVTLADIGVRWSPRNRAFPEFPGLASLYAIKPEWFERNGDTSVTVLLERMESNLSL